MGGDWDKLFADRMKKRGMSWTKKGANRTAKPTSLSRMGRLEVGKGSCAKPAPAFSGPHSDLPWVQVLRELVYGDKKSVAYVGHSEIQPTTKS